MRWTPSSGIPLAACWPPALMTWHLRSAHRIYQYMWINNCKMALNQTRFSYVATLCHEPMNQQLLCSHHLWHRSGVWNRTCVSTTSRPTVKKSTPSSGAPRAPGPTTPAPTSCWQGEGWKFEKLTINLSSSDQMTYHSLVCSQSPTCFCFYSVLSSVFKCLIDKMHYLMRWSVLISYLISAKALLSIYATNF